MTASSTIVVVFDQLSREDFFRRLEWPALVRAWSKTLTWRSLSTHRVSLELAGLDGIDRLTITRRQRGDRIFIGARDSDGVLLQSGVWEYERDSGLCVCYRRVYRPELVTVLRERLTDFVCATFMK
ncbi:hypothetical protein [Serratia ureilytica]|uniref:hypothetical protein n=1 Tax=Serratia ureilytica TaxID=300181 RepID=UPI001D18C016|nr:hypothetical protein [Serratia ureilytica]MCC4107172.1 hypothetical protein [Serratia ureilytica]